MFLLQTQISLWFRQRERRANLHPGTDDPEKRQITLVPGCQTNRSKLISGKLLPMLFDGVSVNVLLRVVGDHGGSNSCQIKIMIVIVSSLHPQLFLSVTG